MGLDSKAVFEKVVVGVVTALLLGALALLWNWGSNGGLVRALGGLTREQLAEEVRKLIPTGSVSEAGRIGDPGTVLNGAVVAFDLDGGCPLGWTVFTPATGRMIIGQGNQYSVGLESDQAGEHLTPQKYRGHGGEERHRLTVEEMPSHQHSYRTSEYFTTGSANSGEAAWRATVGATEFAGGGKSHNNMPPYIALSYCKK